MKWFTSLGLVLDIIGASFLAYGLVISKKKAIELGLAYLASDKDEENLKIPTVADRIKQSKNAIIGLLFLVVGFIFQIIGSWPKT